ncbi:histidine kinase [Pedobacter sp. P351]|uniref:sensor histidine kinase n=1 Tax=Pedobacter superstes TaxID=3133441 RepID=UPI0030A3D34C
MKHIFIPIVFILIAGQHGYSQQESASAAFTHVDVKKKNGGKICDTCQANFVHSAEAEFSYVITGAGRTPERFSRSRRSFKSSREIIRPASLFYISQRNIGISFLPNFIQAKGKRKQLYRNFGGEDYTNLEFQAEQNSRVIRQWTPLYTLGEDQDYAILGTKDISNGIVSMPWKQTFHAGNFNLNIGDTLNITVRNILSKKIIQTIIIFRAIDKANNFMYYQLPLTSDRFSVNLQNILNVSSGIPAVYRGDSSTIFEKDYGSIGLLRFGDLNRNDVIQYSSSENNYATWDPIKPEGPGGAFIVLSNDMEAGKDQEINLRYMSQPETVHTITIRVKPRPFRIPWARIALISILLLTIGGIWFYIRDKRNKRKLAMLRSKNENIEIRLSLLSGQLNPHFLFNSLNAIQGTINSSNPGRANTYIGNVASFMRDVMDNGKKEFISLKEELKLEVDYLKLEQERMDFFYFITVAPSLDPSQIDFPPLLLQPVLENSIRHAFSTVLPVPAITVNISRSDTTLCVEVSDNGIADWNTAGLKEGHGLSLIRKRISVYNEKLEAMSIQMQIKYQDGEGTITTFTFQNWLA